jgi:tetratricopeptide (TPR) repeat protein
VTYGDLRDQLRVTAQLIDATTDTHLWSERWDRPSKEFFAVQSDIASQLGNRLGEAGVIDKAEQEAARRSRPDNFSAYELYLLGRSEALRMSADGNAKALELFEKAVAADPSLARAWADLAYTRQNSTNYGGDTGPLGQKRSRRLVGLSKSILATPAPTRRSAMFWQCRETSDPAKPNSTPLCVSIRETPTS